MCMPEPKLSGKPDAGNLPVRFDEGRGGRSSAPLLLSFDLYLFPGPHDHERPFGRFVSAEFQPAGS